MTLEEQLINAAKAGKVDVVKDLLDRGANIHTEEGGALRRAASNGHTETIRLLLDRGADVNTMTDAPLHYAVTENHIEAVALLLERGANIHADDDWALRRAASERAANKGDNRVVQLLLDNGANVHADQDCALRWAAHGDNNETVKLLLKRYSLRKLMIALKNSDEPKWIKAWSAIQEEIQKRRQKEAASLRDRAAELEP